MGLASVSKSPVVQSVYTNLKQDRLESLIGTTRVQLHVQSACMLAVQTDASREYLVPETATVGLCNLEWYQEIKVVPC
jgi:hypothetical protein